jgi:3-oxoacyl-[acyl-carrier-protein] synthase III
MPSVIIAGVGAYAPERVLTNDDLAKMVDTSDEWIRTRSGIRERRIAAPDQACSDLGIHAANAALKDAGVAASEIDLLIVATATPDYPLPSTACVMQHKLGIPKHATAFDIAAACSGFVYALEIAYGQLLTGRYKCALVVGAEKLSSIVDWSDRTTCVLFGDGAGAAVLKKVPTDGIGIIGCDLGADGELTEYLYTPAGGSRCPATPQTVADKSHFLKMKGKEIFKNAVRVMEKVAREMVEQHNLSLDQINLVIPHQANTRIVEALAGNLGLPMEKFYVNIDRFGNTSSASIPIALDEARRAGRIKPGDLTLLVAFGAGFTYGSTLIRW